MKNKFIFAIAAFLWTASPVLAVEAVDAGNAVCPVSGDKVSGKHFVEYEGKRYALCCPHCEKEFKKDPAKFIASLGESSEDTHNGQGHEGHRH